MAFPTIPTTGNGRIIQGTQADESGTRTFPAFSGLTGLAAWQLLIAVIVAYRATGGSGATFSGWSNGFTELTDQGTFNATDASATMAVGVAYKWTTGSETGSLSVTQAATVDGHVGMFLMAISGAHPSTVPAVGTLATGTTSAADPGALNPSGWDVEDTLWISVSGRGEISTTGSWTGDAATAPANYGNMVETIETADAQGAIAASVAFRQNATASEDVPAWGSIDVSDARNCALTIAVRPTVPIPVTITQATESDSPQAVSFVMGTDSIGGPATETDLANTIVPLQPLPASETDTAQSVSFSQEGPQHIDITTALETDAALLVFVRANLAAETDAAVALRGAPRILTATETDEAQPVTFAQASDYDLTAATETYTAEALSIAQASDYDITEANETDAAAALAVYKLTLATETDTAEALTYSQAGAVDILPALETDTAEAVTYAQASDYDLVEANETDTALALSIPQSVAITPATETDMANQIVPLQTLPALETDAAQALSYEISGAQHIDITPVTETTAAQAVTASKGVTLPEYEATPPIPYGTVTIGDTSTALELTVSGPTGVDILPASETDSPQALTAAKQVTVTTVSETDSAEALGLTGQQDISPALETDTAGTLRAPKLTLAAETDEAQALTYSQAGAYTIAPALETDSAQAVTYAQASDYSITPATETDTAFARAVYKLTPASETDTAQALSGSSAGNLTPATETSTAVALTFTRTRNLTTATETSTAVAVTRSKAVTLVHAAETDEAPGLPYGGAYDILPASETNTATALRYGALPRNGRINFYPIGHVTRTRTGRITKPKEGVLT